MRSVRHVELLRRIARHSFVRNQSSKLIQSTSAFDACRQHQFFSTNAQYRETEQSGGSFVVTSSQRLTATQSPKTPSLSDNVPLTVIDVQLRHEQLPFAYFFEETLDAELLASSLRDVLQWYPVLCGSINLAAGRIECNPDRDTIPLSFAKTNKPLAHWLQEGRGHGYKGGGGHPELMPLFDPLFMPSQSETKNNQQNNDDFEDLLKIRVTHCEGGGTVIGVNMNHALGDASSMIRFVQCWGREMRKKAYPRGASNDRSSATCSGMLTEELTELMGFDAPSGSTNETPMFAPVSSVYNDVACFVQTQWSGLAGVFAPGGFLDPEYYEEKQPSMQTEDGNDEHLPVNHEYVVLPFSKEALNAMKAYGMEVCYESNRMERGATPSGFVSTNDMMTAFGWMIKRELSGNNEWGISMVVNLRGRCGVDDFTDMNNTDEHTKGVFGNGITNVTASLPSTTQSNGERKPGIILLEDIAAGAMAIRNALTNGLADVPERIASSRMGKPQSTMAAASGPSFSTTSWGQFPLWSISFSSQSQSKLSGFHGHPSHPLPLGRTFSSVIAPTQDGCYHYKLLVPSDKAEEAKRIHKQLCSMFIKWHEESVKK